MKVAQIGPDSIHFRNFCGAIRPLLGEFIYIGEEKMSSNGSIPAGIFSFRGFNILKWLYNYSRLRSFIKSENPDIIHIHQANRLAWLVCLVAKGLNIPVITTVWGSDILIVPFKNFIFRFITKNILKHSSIVTADSEEIIETMQYLFPADKYIKLQYGIDPIFPVEKKNFIYSNRLHQKLYRIDLILKEFASFSEKYPDWQLIIAATGKETENLKKITNNLNLQNKVVFTGWLTKKENDELYSKSSIYISIPTSDGTSVSLLEAMSAGCIPVVSDLPVSREWINDGLNGIIFKPGDNSFEKAICIDFNSCKEINNEKIKKYALRKNNTKEFYKLYETIIGSLKVPL